MRQNNSLQDKRTVWRIVCGGRTSWTGWCQLNVSQLRGAEDKECVTKEGHHVETLLHFSDNWEEKEILHTVNHLHFYQLTNFSDICYADTQEIRLVLSLCKSRRSETINQ